MPDYRMKWIRIWPHAWFDSSMRVELTNEERAFWVDIIALAGKSRIPGVICSDPDGLTGYPLPMLCSLLVSWTPEQAVRTLEKLEKTNRLQIKRVPLMSGEDGWIVHITNWKKYQSEAQRVQKYKKKVYPSTPHSRKKHRTEVEVDVEEEVEGKSSSDDDPLTLLPELKKGFPKHRLTEDDVAWACGVIRSRASSPPGSLAFWRKALFAFMENADGEIAAHHKRIAESGEARTGHNPHGRA